MPFNMKQIKQLLCYALATIYLYLPSALAAERIITLSPGTTELVYAIGAGDKIIATVEHSDYPEQAASLPHIGNYQSINIEAILALKPDLIIAWPDGNPAPQLAQLEQMGLAIHYSNAATLNDLPLELIKLGSATGDTKKAQQVAQKYQRKLTELKERYKNRETMSLFYQVWPEPLMSVSNNSWIGESVLLCGGQNIFADSKQPFPLVSIEHVLLKKPQIIIAADKKQSVLEHWQKWPMLPAVKKQHLYTLEPDHLHRYGPRLLLGISQLCEAIDKARNH